MLSRLAGTTVPERVGRLPLSAEALPSLQTIKRVLKPDCLSSPKSKIRGKVFIWRMTGGTRASLAHRSSAETMKQICLYSCFTRELVAVFSVVARGSRRSQHTFITLENSFRIQTSGYMCFINAPRS